MAEPQAQVLALSLAYVLAGVLLLAVLIRLRLARWLKLGAVLAAGGCYLIVFFASENLLGWSAPAAVPAHFQLLWGRIVEPDRALGRAGAIHLWLEALDDANLPSGVPRAYLLPYSAALAGRVAEAQREIRKGHKQGGRAELFGSASDTSPGLAAGPTRTPPGGDPSGGGLLDPAFLGGQAKSVELEPLPAPALPAKGDPAE